MSGDGVRELPHEPAPETAATILELKEGQCRWPVGAGDRRQLFCGAGVDEPGCSWCATHRARATAKVQTPKVGRDLIGDRRIRKAKVLVDVMGGWA